MSKVHTLKKAAPTAAPGPVTTTKSVQLLHTKSTKGTHVYSATTDENVICTTVYLVRGELPDPPPAEVTLNVTFTA